MALYERFVHEGRADLPLLQNLLDKFYVIEAYGGFCADLLKDRVEDFMIKLVVMI